MTVEKIELNDQGIRELLHSTGIANALTEQAERVARNCNGQAGQIYNAGTRNIVSVWAKDGDDLLRALK